MNKQEFLTASKYLIKDSLYENELLKELENIYSIIDKYNESIKTLSIKNISMYKDPRFMTIVDKNQYIHGSIFVDRDKINFELKMDNYVLNVTVDTLGTNFYKETKYNQYIEFYDDDEDDVELFNQLPNDKKLETDNGLFTAAKSVEIVQVSNKREEHSITAKSNTFDINTHNDKTTTFEFNSANFAPTNITIFKDINGENKSHYQYSADKIATPSNSINCVTNKAFGYIIQFGIEDYIYKMENKRLKDLGCDSLLYHKSTKFNPTKQETGYIIQSMFDNENI